jgi:hypothetical protein
MIITHDADKIRHYILEEVAMNIAFSLTCGDEDEVKLWRARAMGVVSLVRDLFYQHTKQVLFHGVPVTEEIKEDLLAEKWPKWFDKHLLD